MTELSSLIFAFQLACKGQPDMSKMPTPEEIQIAANFVGLEKLPDIISISELGCLDEYGEVAGLYYPGYRIVLLEENYREEDGGLTVLVHELRHQYQDDNKIPMTECDAADYGARWAAYAGELERWPVEAIYGLRHCVGGKKYDHDEDYALLDAVAGMLTVFPEFIDPTVEEDYDPLLDESQLWDGIREEGFNDVDSD